MPQQPVKPTAQDIEREFPLAVAHARELRAVFGEGVKILYARNAKGEEIGRQDEQNGRI